MIPNIENAGVMYIQQSLVPLEGLTLRLWGLRHHGYRICVCLKQFIKESTVGRRVTNFIKKICLHNRSHATLAGHTVILEYIF